MRCVLIAGLPASGKTTFAEHLGGELGLPVLSKDRIKELMYDTIGFAGRAEKITLSTAATRLLYYYAESLMRAGQSFILENNFENVTKPQLQNLLAAYAYRPLTVRFGGDIRVIYERYARREQSPGRHGGHKGSAWPPPAGGGLLQAPLTLDEFIAGVEDRGIRDFSVGGEEIFVDSTRFEQVRYSEIVGEVRRRLESGLEL